MQDAGDWRSRRQQAVIKEMGHVMILLWRLATSEEDRQVVRLRTDFDQASSRGGDPLRLM